MPPGQHGLDRNARLSARPAFCPNPSCHWHAAKPSSALRFIRRGRVFVQRQTRPLQVFQCQHCRRRFRESVFTQDYWRHIRRLSTRVFPLLADGQCLRQAARALRVGPDAVLLSQRRLARQALLIHLDQLRRLEGQISEPVAFDGLRNLVGSVHQMAEVTTAYTVESGFTLAALGFGTTYGGPMTADQARSRAQRLAQLGAPNPRGRERSAACVARLLQRLASPHLRLEVRTDEEPQYRRPLERLARIRALRHVTVSSRARRDSTNPLWQVNHRHRFARHALANLKRETIAYSKTLRGLMERFFIHAVYTNLVKGVSERHARGRATTPAMKLCLATRKLMPEELVSSRRFPEREKLPASWRALYRGDIKGWSKEHVRVREFKFAG
jgi:hypothetical protein